MQKIIVTVLFIVVGLINLVPIVGVISAEQLTRLYGIEFSEGNMIILMRHRALLLGIVGGLLLYAAFQPKLRPAGFVVGFVSMLGFIVLAWSAGAYNDALRRVVVADLVGGLLLLVAVGLNAHGRFRES